MSRILNPVVLVIEAIDKLMEKPAVARFIEGSFGTADNCKKTILADFFRHGFNGSGAGTLGCTIRTRFWAIVGDHHASCSAVNAEG